MGTDLFKSQNHLIKWLLIVPLFMDEETEAQAFAT